MIIFEAIFRTDDDITNIVSTPTKTQGKMKESASKPALQTAQPAQSTQSSSNQKKKKGKGKSKSVSGAVTTEVAGKQQEK